MEALKLAFDTIIIGSLALPWVWLGICLFAPNQVPHFKSLIERKEGNNLAPVAGVFLFAIVYSLGAAISRVSSDFFNDDDLYAPLPINKGLTEDHIRASVYCNVSERTFFDVDVAASPNGISPNHTEKPSRMSPDAFKKWCNDNVSKLFYFQESAVLLQGSDKTERLNQLHAQISVLRGAAFNGLITFFVCSFGFLTTLTARLKRLAPHKSVWIMVWIVAWIIPIALCMVGGSGLQRHKAAFKGLDDPPFMELTVILWGIAGGYLLAKEARRRAVSKKELAKEATPKAALTPTSDEPQAHQRYGSYLLLSFLLTGVAIFGWWWSEVLYDKQVLHSFYAQHYQYPTSAQ